MQFCNICVLLILNQIHLICTLASVAFLVSSVISFVAEIKKVEFKDIGGGWSGDVKGEQGDEEKGEMVVLRRKINV